MCAVLLCQTHHTIEQKVRKSSAAYGAVIVFVFVYAIIGVRCARYCCAKRTIQSNTKCEIRLLYKYNTIFIK